MTGATSRSKPQRSIAKKAPVAYPAGHTIRGVGCPLNGIAVVLDNPSKWLWTKQAHLIGDEASLLYKTLAAAGFKESDVYITYAIPHLYEGKASTEDIKRNHVNLLKELEAVQPRKILCVGATAYAVLNGKSSVGNADHLRGGAFYTELSGRNVYTVPTIPPYYVTGTPERFKDFWWDVQKLAACNEVQSEPKPTMIIPQTLAELETALLILSNASVLTCDTETSGLKPQSDKIESIGFGGQLINEIVTVIIPWELLHVIDKYSEAGTDLKFTLLNFMRYMTELGVPTVFHNAKFDLQFLTAWFQTSLWDIDVRDTLLMNYLLDERPVNAKATPHGLKTISRVRYDAADYKFDFKVFWENPKELRSKEQWQALYDYLGLDLAYTCMLYSDLVQELREENAEQYEYLLTQLLMPATKVLAEVEFFGAPVDEEYFQNYGVELRNDLKTITDEIRDLLINKAAIDPEFAADFNPGSPQQVGKLLYDMLHLPAPKDRSTDKNTLNDEIHALKTNPHLLAKYSPILPSEAIELLYKILDYRAIKKVLGTYVDGLLEHASGTGHVHTQFNIPGTRTGRLSANDPALQTIPQMSGPAVRRGFVAPPGYIWMKADYSQLELRVAAYLSQDPMMIQAYVDNRDIHNEVAAAMFGIQTSEVTKKQRYAAKFVDFGVLYGRGAFSLAHGPELREFNWSEKQAQKFIDNYLAQFKKLGDWMDNQRKEVIAKQILATPLGRRRRWPFLTRNEAYDSQKQALNFPVQSTASDFTLNALVTLYKKLRGFKSRIVLTVHDEIDLLVADEELDEVAHIVKDAMENHLPLDVNVPIVAEVEIGPNWADVKPFDWGS